jgi:N-acetylglutamate synthase-like GNAT family acetyltransferase
MPLEPWEECEAGFYVMVTPTGEKAGFGGMEIYGKIGYIRSMVINKAMRGKGLGQMLAMLLITRAHMMGITSLYLLTHDKEDFFIKLGFKEMSREEAPGDVKSNAQFSGLCPKTDILMVLNLGEG